MSLLRPLDPNFPIERQLGIEASPVVLVNIFTLDKADEPGFLKIWQDDAAFMKRCSATIWMRRQRQSVWPFWRSRRRYDCRSATITQALFRREMV